MRPLTEDELRSFASAMQGYSATAAGIMRLLDEIATQSELLSRRPSPPPAPGPILSL